MFAYVHMLCIMYIQRIAPFRDNEDIKAVTFIPNTSYAYIYIVMFATCERLILCCYWSCLQVAHPMFAAPALQHGERFLSQTVSILDYLGRKFELASTPETLQYALDVADLWSEAWNARKSSDQGTYTYLTSPVPI